LKGKKNVGRVPFLQLAKTKLRCGNPRRKKGSSFSNIGGEAQLSPYTAHLVKPFFVPKKKKKKHTGGTSSRKNVPTRRTRCGGVWARKETPLPAKGSSPRKPFPEKKKGGLLGPLGRNVPLLLLTSEMTKGPLFGKDDAKVGEPKGERWRFFPQARGGEEGERKSSFLPKERKRGAVSGLRDGKKKGGGVTAHLAKRGPAIGGSLHTNQGKGKPLPRKEGSLQLGGGRISSAQPGKRPAFFLLNPGGKGKGRPLPSLLATEKKGNPSTAPRGGGGWEDTRRDVHFDEKKKKQQPGMRRKRGGERSTFFHAKERGSTRAKNIQRGGKRSEYFTGRAEMGFWGREECVDQEGGKKAVGRTKNQPNRVWRKEKGSATRSPRGRKKGKEFTSTLGEKKGKRRSRSVSGRPTSRARKKKESFHLEREKMGGDLTLKGKAHGPEYFLPIRQEKKRARGTSLRRGERLSATKRTVRSEKRGPIRGRPGPKRKKSWFSSLGRDDGGERVGKPHRVGKSGSSLFGACGAYRDGACPKREEKSLAGMWTKEEKGKRAWGEVFARGGKAGRSLPCGGKKGAQVGDGSREKRRVPSLRPPDEGKVTRNLGCPPKCGKRVGSALFGREKEGKPDGWP